MQNPNSITAGASTAIFGLLGALIGFFYRNRATMGAWGRANLQSLLITAGINFVFTLSIPGISLGGHLGGAIVGLFLGYFLSPLQVRQTIGANAGAGMVRARDFAMEWWPIVATLAVEALVLFIALQGSATSSFPGFR
jgi:membrane associated rhomboid family serine protease